MNCQLLVILSLATLSIFSSCGGSLTGGSDIGFGILTSKRPITHEQWLDAIEKRSVDTENSEYDDFYHGADEPECEEGSFWHVRGLKCVLIECPGGNRFRNKYTGECYLRNYGYSNEENHQQLRSSFKSRNKTPTKLRLPFGLTLKG